MKNNTARYPELDFLRNWEAEKPRSRSYTVTRDRDGEWHFTLFFHDLPVGYDNVWAVAAMEDLWIRVVEWQKKGCERTIEFDIEKCQVRLFHKYQLGDEFRTNGEYYGSFSSALTKCLNEAEAADAAFFGVKPSDVELNNIIIDEKLTSACVDIFNKSSGAAQLAFVDRLRQESDPGSCNRQKMMAILSVVVEMAKIDLASPGAYVYRVSAPIHDLYYMIQLVAESRGY